MNPVIDGLVAAVLGYVGRVFVVLCLASLVLLLLIEYKLGAASLPVDDSIHRLRVYALVWLGKGCLMIIASDVLSGTFKWRK